MMEKGNLSLWQVVYIHEGDPKQIAMGSVQQTMTDKGMSGEHHGVYSTVQSFLKGF